MVLFERTVHLGCRVLYPARFVFRHLRREETSRFGAAICVVGIVLLWPPPGVADQPAPVADVHLHYNWDQAEILDPPEAIRRLKDNGVVLAVVSSKPPALALELADAADGWIFPFFMPYLEPERKGDWFYDSRVLPAARDALASGRYQGLGEMHLIVGFAPSLQNRQPIIDELVELAVEYDVPLSMHVEAGNHRYFLPLCKRHPKARIFWAHAGGVLKAREVSALLDACPNVWVDMSARDLMRYGGSHAIVDDEGRLKPEWERIALDYHERIMIGSDPFFVEEQLYWDEPNTGWDHLDTLFAFHRRWLSYLPEEIARKIRVDNATRFFKAQFLN
ncbi:MAG: amidohydrolase [Gammaproteobacteria bacterium]|nr:amidohydrolase [Gammaproteobacteria bacterium]MDH3467012.1 amidohydrolase [Gammaproteobacteria bacterium]